MSTNEESARKWLEENKESISEERVLQIRSNLVKKINLLAEPDNMDPSDEHQGLLEALDVMDDWLHEHAPPIEVQAEVSELDYSPLIQESSEPAQHLSHEEKLRRFQQLLKTSK